MKPTILVVDDDESVRQLLGEVLAEAYHVISAEDGYDGLSEVLMGDRPVDLVITDLHMPGHNGVELIEDLPEGIPVIVISGFLSTPKYRDALDELNPVAVFEKPFELTALYEAIGQALSGKRQTPPN